jgi:hypothetical protein
MQEFNVQEVSLWVFGKLFALRKQAQQAAEGCINNNFKFSTNHQIFWGV